MQFLWEPYDQRPVVTFTVQFTQTSLCPQRSRAARWMFGVGILDHSEGRHWKKAWLRLFLVKVFSVFLMLSHLCFHSTVRSHFLAWPCTNFGVERRFFRDNQEVHIMMMMMIITTKITTTATIITSITKITITTTITTIAIIDAPIWLKNNYFFISSPSFSFLHYILLTFPNPSPKKNLPGTPQPGIRTPKDRLFLPSTSRKSRKRLVKR